MNRNSGYVYLLAKIKQILIWPIAKIKYGNKKVWLICERGTDARDNGYHMFRYLRTNHPEIEAWYIITRDSADLKKIADLGNIAFRGSLNHWLLYLYTTRVLTAFEPGYVPSGNNHFAMDIIKKNNQKTIFLQHGITAWVDLPIYYKERAKFDMFICGAKPEYDYVSSHFHYNDDEVRYTGFARFDALHDAITKKQILIMPTWRRWLRNLSESEVAQSEYVEKWNQVLRNPRLVEIAEKYNIDIIFYPHQLMQKFVGLFLSENNHIIIADCYKYDVQPLLKESALLITDYSSVSFDFAYMKKSLLYYQFDEEKIYADHNKRGYFDFQEMGFGEKVKKPEELINLIDQYVTDDFHLKTEFEQRIDSFFTLRDQCNCKRIFQEIVNTFK